MSHNCSVFTKDKITNESGEGEGAGETCKIQWEAIKIETTQSKYSRELPKKKNKTEKKAKKRIHPKLRMHFLLLLLVFYALQCAQKMHEVKRAISLNAFAKKMPEMEKKRRNREKKNRKKWYAIFLHNEKCSRQTHTHTHTRAEKCIAWVELWYPDPKIYILKLKWDCLSKCKQSKGVRRHTHAHTHTSTPYTHSQKVECIFVHLAKGRPLVEGFEFRAYAAHN